MPSTLALMRCVKTWKVLPPSIFVHYTTFHFWEMRGISNLVEDRQLARWDIPGAVDAAQSALIKIINDRKIMGYVRDFDPS